MLIDDDTTFPCSVTVHIIRTYSAEANEYEYDKSWIYDQIKKTKHEPIWHMNNTSAFVLRKKIFFITNSKKINKCVHPDHNILTYEESKIKFANIKQSFQM